MKYFKVYSLITSVFFTLSFFTLTYSMYIKHGIRTDSFYEIWFEASLVFLAIVVIKKYIKFIVK